MFEFKLTLTVTFGVVKFESTFILNHQFYDFLDCNHYDYSDRRIVSAVFNVGDNFKNLTIECVGNIVYKYDLKTDKDMLNDLLFEFVERKYECLNLDSYS